MHPTAGEASRRGPHEAKLAIERFLKASQQPVLLEAGEDPIPLSPENFVLELRDETLTLQAWSEARNLVRRVCGVEEEKRGRLELVVERFGKRVGTLLLADLAAPHNQGKARRSTVLKFRELFRRFLSRQYPGWRIAALSAEADLEHTLSPAYPRALVRKGSRGWAAIGAGAECTDPDGVLSFGLIWLDYLRRREPLLTIEGLALFVPEDRAKNTCLRLHYLDPGAARYAVFAHSKDGFEASLDLRDYGNLDTHLEPCRRPLPALAPELALCVERLQENREVQFVGRADGSVSLRVRGLEFARITDKDLLFGLDWRRPARESNAGEIERLAMELARMRHAGASDRRNPLYTRAPEAWLESQVRSQVEAIDATLLASPIYGQVPAFAGGDRGVIDLLAADRSGRLAVVELKASQDIHLPLQGLDYWIRVKWHLDREDFSEFGYFPGAMLRREAPRMLLVAPALEFHPANEVILRYFAPEIEVERIGLGLEWRQGLKVMFQFRGSRGPYSL